MTAAKKKQIIAVIARQAVDPKTNLPHPSLRIEQAMEQIRFSISPFKDAEEQAKDVIKLLRPVLPLKVEKIQVKLHIPAEYAARTYGTVKSYGALKSEKWQADGSWSSIIEMPAGLYGPLLDKLGELTRGSAEARKI